MTYGILSFGAYVPHLRLARSAILDAVGWAVPGVRGLAAGERAVANWDEDSITLAVEAARDCLAGVDGPVGQVSLASTTLPFADRSNSGVVADALDLDHEVLTEDLAGSRRAATSALARAARGHGHDTTLLVAADTRETRPGSSQEMLYGHGAAALLIGEGKPVAEFLAAASVHEDMVDQYRATDTDFDYALEERWVREEGYLKIVPDVVEQAAAGAGIQVGDIDHVVLHGSTGVARALAKPLGIDPKRFADPLTANCGDTGVPHPLLMLASVLDNAGPDQYVLVIGFGQGADAIILRTTPALALVRAGRGAGRALAQRRPLANYTQFLSLRNQISIDFGLRSERDNRTALSAYYRKRRDITAMRGGRCRECNTLQFPRALVCVKCGAAESQTPESLAALTGRVKSFTEDWLAYTPSPPYIYGNVEFPDGANVMLEFTDFGAGQIKVGDPVRLVFRVKDYDTKRHFRRYFWKPAPLPVDGD
ncbi:MAG: OB-fold domain-containing protein [Gammaproteobacteria bacterium]|nr:OB-fold domain-containing protein [Gammaproteobacteria bacterium]MCP5198438.1 OB-fold domain-containing protein [Gammaproteobacteria bacterium]